MRKKKHVKKKTKKGCCWVTIQQLYHDTEAGKAGLGARGWATTWPATPTIRLGRACNTAERKAQHGLQCARPGWGTMSRYNILYRDRRQLGCWVVSRDRLATRRRSCDTTRSDTRGGEAIQCATRPTRLATRPGSATTRQGTPATQPGDGYDTELVRPRHSPVRGVPPAWAQCAQWTCSLGSRCAPGAPNPVLDSMHCFSHYLGTLFLSTVHKFF